MALCKATQGDMAKCQQRLLGRTYLSIPLADLELRIDQCVEIQLHISIDVALMSWRRGNDQANLPLHFVIVSYGCVSVFLRYSVKQMNTQILQCRMSVLCSLCI